MDFTEVLRTRRSVRSYAEKDIPEEILERVLEAARVAPSGNNLQPWHFIVVREAKRKREIASACYGQGFIADAPVVLVCCGSRYASPYEPHGGNGYLTDVAIAIDHLVLAARNEGLGTCWIGALHPQPIRDAVGLPSDWDPLMVVPLGYPRRDDAFREVSSRKKLKDIVSRERFGTPWS